MAWKPPKINRQHLTRNYKRLTNEQSVRPHMSITLASLTQTACHGIPSPLTTIVIHWHAWHHHSDTLPFTADRRICNRTSDSSVADESTSWRVTTDHWPGSIGLLQFRRSHQSTAMKCLSIVADKAASLAPTKSPTPRTRVRCISTCTWRPPQDQQYDNYNLK